MVRLMFGVCKKLLSSIRVKNYQHSKKVKKSSLPHVFRDSSSPTQLPSLHFRILSPPTSLPGNLFYHLWGQGVGTHWRLPLGHSIISAFRKVFWVHTHIPYLRAVSTSTPTSRKRRMTARPSWRPCPRVIRPWLSLAPTWLTNLSGSRRVSMTIQEDRGFVWKTLRAFSIA